MALTLTLIETAIETIQTTGQSVSVEGMSYSAANIDALMRLRDQLKVETNRSNGSRPVFRGFEFNNMGY